MRKYIVCGKEAREKLMSIFEVKAAMVSRSLNYDIDSELSRKIRHTALTQLGGRESTELPIEETIHDYKGIMTQMFLNGATLRMNKKSGHTIITDKHGNVAKEVYVTKIEDLEACQKLAANWQS